MGLKASIKSMGMAVLPRTTMELLSARSQKLIMDSERNDGRLAASKEFVRRFGRTVQAGPFQGLTYPETTIMRRNLVHKLLATYEHQLHEWLEIAINSNYKKIINIGSADGYYTVGLAKRCPDAEVIAFDTDAWARAATEEFANENNVNNVSVLSFCTSAWLNRNVSSGTLLLVDCEGAEAHLLDVNKAPALLAADIIVELHEHVVRDLSATLNGRFDATHEIQTLGDPSLDGQSIPQLEFLDPPMRDRVVSEGRMYQQKWQFIRRRSSVTI